MSGFIEQVGRSAVVLLAHPQEPPDRRAYQDSHDHAGNEPGQIFLRLASRLFNGIDKLARIGRFFPVFLNLEHLVPVTALNRGPLYQFVLASFQTRV